MKRTLLILVALFTCLAMAAPVMACQGPDCVDVTADATAETILGNTVVGLPGSSSYAGGNSIADVSLTSEANATAEDHDVWTTTKVWVDGYRHYGWHSHGYYSHKGYHNHSGHYDTVKTKVTVPGEADATATSVMTQSGSLLVLSNGPQASGLAGTFVKSTATLDYDGSALATGSPGCPQFAEVNLSGSLTAEAWGNATVDGPYGNQAAAGGSGFTTVSFAGNDSEYDHNGPEADASLSGTVRVDQSLFAEAFVSEDGTFSQTFAAIGTGNASERGRDVSITGINSSGMVSQGSYATNGQGAYAAGNSTASYNNVTNGSAVVFGLNSVVTTPNSVTVSAHHSAHASGTNVGSPQ